MGVWISLPEVCVRCCSNCHAIVAGSRSEGALRVRGNEYTKRNVIYYPPRCGVARFEVT